MIKTRVTRLLNAVTSTSTSGNHRISGAQRVGFMVKRANNAGGSSTFTFAGGVVDPIAASGAEVAMVTLSVMLDNVTGAITHVANKAISAANGTALIWLDSAYVLDFINVTATIASDGDATVWIIEEYWD